MGSEAGVGIGHSAVMFQRLITWLKSSKKVRVCCICDDEVDRYIFRDYDKHQKDLRRHRLCWVFVQWMNKRERNSGSLANPSLW